MTNNLYPIPFSLLTQVLNDIVIDMDADPTVDSGIKDLRAKEQGLVAIVNDPQKPLWGKYERCFSQCCPSS